jgi:heme A synthase
MSFNTTAVANALVSVLQGLSGMGTVQIGTPESVGPRVMSYVTLGSQATTRKVIGVVTRDTRFFCMFAYRLDGAEAAAETTLMSLVDAFMAALFADLTLGGTVTSLEANSQAADEPDYQLRAGKEYREYPVMVTVTQRDSYEVNP